MMNQEKDKWINDVFLSMKGSAKAKPNPDLLSKIESSIDKTGAKTVDMYSYKKIAVAAVILLLINVSTMISYQKHSGAQLENPVSEDGYGQLFTSSYQIY